MFGRAYNAHNKTVLNKLVYWQVCVKTLSVFVEIIHEVNILGE
jgi:hypothetical protein